MHSEIQLRRPPSLVEAATIICSTRLNKVRPRVRELRVAGRLDPQPRVAIVGTRAADPEAEAFSFELAVALASHGISIVSGGARGIDAAAHRGAFAAAGSTVAVLATGLARAYPPEHAELFSKIAAHGALVSESDDDTPPLRWTFLRRNRIVAALADIVVLVQAPKRSGALSTAAHALKLKVPIAAVPGAPWDLRSEGCNALIRSGKAEPLWSTNQLLERLGPLADRNRTGGRKANDTDATQQRLARPTRPRTATQNALLKVLGHRARHLDEIIARTGLDIADALTALTELAMVGEVVNPTPGRFALGKPTRKTQKPPEADE